VFAQAIHRGSARRERPFVAVNCASLPSELMESELFGYVGGAFSGARREGSPGKFLAAEGGTIFLDEIGELAPSAQASLLRVLQEGEITPVGSARSRAVDVRVIAATNRDLAAALASGRLRTDLYYRINVLPIELPPLRERLADVPALAHHFLAAAAEEVGRPPMTFDPDVVAALAAHSWPGNIRELKNLLRRLAALAPGQRITRDLLPAALAGAPATSASPQPPTAAPADAERARTLAALGAATSMAEAASRLGVTRSTLYRRLARYGLQAQRSVRASGV
jgi:transcriptional regulator with PAS, ATPase and Fis domain